MKVFLSGNSSDALTSIKNEKIKYYLYSFYYFDPITFKIALDITTKELLIDSGAHTFQSGAKTNYFDFCDKYCEFIKKYDCDKIKGYFELDVDHELNYEQILELRKKLESVTNKIIPVWHKERGIEKFIEYTKKYKWVGIAGFKNQDIKDEQFILFNKVAKQNGCKLHGLGLTRFDVLKKNNFYSVDSASWIGSARFGKLYKFKDGQLKILKEKQKKEARKEGFLWNLKEWKKYVNAVDK